MAFSKKEEFGKKEQELAAVAKALSHPARIAIVQHLLRTNACINGDLVEELGLAQATISQHLRALKDAGIIRGTIEGVSVSYCINPETWQMISDSFNGLFESFNCNDQCC